MIVIRAPLDEVLVSREHGVDYLIQHVVRRLSQESRVCVQRLVVLSIEPHDVAVNLFSAGPWFDERHSTPLVMLERAFEVRPKVTHLARRLAGWMSGANPWCTARGDRVPNTLA